MAYESTKEKNMSFNALKTNPAAAVKKLFICSFMVMGMSATYAAEKIDTIELLSSCGTQCWTEAGMTEYKTEAESKDSQIVSCMQKCFATKNNANYEEEIVDRGQVLRIKTSAYCGNVCWGLNKNSNKALGYCYSGCLGAHLQSPKNQ